VKRDTWLSEEDDDLRRFETHGAPPLPPTKGLYLENDGARLWYCELGRGTPVVLLHGGMATAAIGGFRSPSCSKAASELS